MSFPWDEVVGDFFKERGTTITLTPEQWAEFEDVIDAAVSEINEIASYGHPSSSDVARINWEPKVKAAEKQGEYEAQWRDERIAALESANRRLSDRIRALEADRE